MNIIGPYNSNSHMPVIPNDPKSEVIDEAGEYEYFEQF